MPETTETISLCTPPEFSEYNTQKRSFWDGMGRKKGWRMTAQYVAKYRRFFMSSLQMAFVCKRKCNILVHGLVFLSVNTLGHKMRLEGQKGTIFSFINAEKQDSPMQKWD